MNLSNADLKKLKHILYKFIWNRHYLAAKAPERIKREITNKPILEGGLGMLAIEDLDASLKLRALGRLKGTKHPMLKLFRDMLDVEDFFFPEDKSKLDSVLERAVHLLRKNRQDSWKDNEFNREKHYVDCIKSIKLCKIVSPVGRNSLAYFAIRRTGATRVAEQNLMKLESIKLFINRDLYRVIKEMITIVLPILPLGDVNYSIVAKGKLFDLTKLSSKKIRTELRELDPVTIFKIGAILTPSEALSLAAQINKLTSIKHKDILLRLLHGELYSKEKLSRFGLIDNASCPRCGEVETLNHKYIECEYVKAIWSKCLQRTNELRTAVNPTENDLEKVLCCLEPNKTVLTVHSEVIMRIRALKENVDHLLLPKIFVKNAITSVSKKEQNQEIKNQLLHLIDN